MNYYRGEETDDDHWRRDTNYHHQIVFNNQKVGPLNAYAITEPDLDRRRTSGGLRSRLEMMLTVTDWIVEEEKKVIKTVFINYELIHGQL